MSNFFDRPELKRNFFESAPEQDKSAPTSSTPLLTRSQDGDFMRGLKRTLPELKQLGGGTMAAIGDVTGWDGLRDKGLQIYRDQEAALQPNQRPTDSASEAWRRVKSGDFGAGVDFLQNAAGYTTGQALESLTAAGAGALIGGAVTPEVGGAGAIPGAVGGFLAKQGVKRAVKAEAERLVADQVAKGVAKTEAKKAAAGFVAQNATKDAVAAQVGKQFTEAELRQMGGRAIGGAIGAQGMNSVMELGSVYPDAYNAAQAEGRDMTAGEKARAVGASLAAAGVESAADMFNLGKLVHGLHDAGADAATTGLKRAAINYGKRAAVEVPEGMLREAGTEAVQTGLERYGARQSLTGDEANRDYFDSAITGAVGGGLFGGVAAIHRNAGDAPKLTRNVPSTNQPGTPLALPAPDGTPDYGTIRVTPDGTAITEPQRAGIDAQNEATGLTPDVEAARAAHPGAAPNTVPLSRGPRVPFEGAAPGSLADAVNATSDAAQGAQVDAKTKALQEWHGLFAGLNGAAVPSGSPLAMEMDRRRARAIELGATEDELNGFTQPDALVSDPDGGTPAPARGSLADAVKDVVPPPAVATPAQPDSALQPQPALGQTPAAQAPSPARTESAGETAQPADAGAGTRLAGESEGPSPQSAPTGAAPQSTVTAADLGARAAGESITAGNATWTKQADGRWSNGTTNMTGESLARVAALPAPATASQPEPGPDATPQTAAPSPVAAAAAEAATSPKNDRPEPTEAQKEAGNYKKGHVKIGGLDISIENEAGTSRRPEWPPLKHHYGYLKGTIGKDKDHVDVFLTENAEDTSRPVFVVDQYDKGKFDEHKVVLGAATEQEAREAYLANYSPDFQQQDGARVRRGAGAITQMTQEQFKAWSQDPVATKLPAASGGQATSADTAPQADEPASTGAAIEDEIRPAGKKRDRGFTSAASVTAAITERGLSPDDYEVTKTAEGGFIGKRKAGKTAAPKADNQPGAKAENQPGKADIERIEAKEKAADSAPEGFTAIPGTDNEWRRSQKIGGTTWGYNLKKIGGKYFVRASATFDSGVTGAPSVDLGRDLTLAAALNVVSKHIADRASIGASNAPTAAADPFANNTIFTSDKVAAAKARLKAKLGTLNSGVDPEMFVDGATIAGAYIESGVRKFGDYAKAMVADLGEAIKPYLLSFYEGVRHYPGFDSKGMDSAADAQREFDALLTPADLQADAIGNAKPPRKTRAKATTDRGARTLRDDWGVDHINGYSNTSSREEGNDTKDAYLKDASAYLKAVAEALDDQGYTVTLDRKGKPAKAVSVNEGGMAGSGDVSLHMVAPDGTGIYVHVGDTALRGVVNTTTSGIALMYRTTDGTHGKSGANQWGRVDLTAAELAAELVQHVARNPWKPEASKGGLPVRVLVTPIGRDGLSEPERAAGKPPLSTLPEAQMKRLEQVRDALPQDANDELAAARKDIDLAVKRSVDGEVGTAIIDTLDQAYNRIVRQFPALAEVIGEVQDEIAAADKRSAGAQDPAHNAAEEATNVRRDEDFQRDREGAVRGGERQRPAEDRNDDPAAGLGGRQPGEAAETRSERGADATADAQVPGRAGAGERDARAERAPDGDRVPAGGRAAPDAVVPKSNFTITGELDFAGVGAVGKFNGNLAAIRLLKELEANGRRATPEEQSVLARYVGWGGLPQAFRHPTSGKITKGWDARVAELEQALTPEELAAAGRSTQDAHYTAERVVRAMWRAVDRLGFTQGRVLEPSMGTGNFFGLMPQQARAASALTGVELDSITGRIASQLYQGANVQVRGFNDLKIAPESFDLAIGNPPFGSQSIHDPQYPDLSKWSIHNFFFAKSIASLRPGGVLAMVVSSSFLDANTSTTRAWVAERARLLGAIRLPQTAFQQNAGTNVTTDIVFLQRLADGMEGNAQEWVAAGTASDQGQEFPLNRYFLANPDMMLGRMVWSTHTTVGRAGAVLEANPGEDLAAALDAAVAKLPAGVYVPPAKPAKKVAAEVKKAAEAAAAVKVYGYFVAEDGSLRQRQPDANGEHTDVVMQVGAAVDKRIRAMIPVRDATRDLLAAELSDASDAAIEAKRKELNRVYDAFVKANGRISRDVNKRALRDDPDFPLLLSLERDYDKGVTRDAAKKAGVEPRAESAKKADIFTKRTNYPVKPVTSVSDAKSAMLASLNERGRIDLDYMAELYAGKDRDAIIAELGDLVFRTPEGTVEPADGYLSGNVKAKLAAAREAAKDDPGMRRNVAALEKVQPQDVDAADIFVQIGTPWIPAADYADFVRETIEGKFDGRHVPALGKWLVDVQSGNRTLNKERWGTERMGADAIIEAILTDKPIVVKDKGANRDDPPVVNKAETAAALGKASELQTQFVEWLWKDASRRERLARFYNDTFNTDVRRKYDGAHMTFPGMSRGVLTGGKLRPHQSAFAYRMVQDGVAMADHVVGAGKTYAAIAGTMEMRRLGLWRKPMIVVPNHLVDQWASDFLKLYPGANVLAAGRKDFEKSNRRKLFGRIATGDWDAVIVAHSSFGFIPVPAEAEARILRTEIKEIEDALDAIRAESGKKDLSFKQLQKRKEALDTKIKKLNERARDDLLDFAEMGVDSVVLDEAHEFKNLFFVTSKRNVAGLGSPEGSKKAFDLYVKTRMLAERDGGKNRVFLTGTPVSNTLSEVYHMQRYLQREALEERGVASFDAWASVFGQIVSDWEMDAAGRFKEKTRFRKFANLPELVSIWRQVADTVTRADLIRDAEAQGLRFPLPKIKGNKPQNIVVPRSPLQAAYIGVPTPMLDAEGKQMHDPETGEPLATYPEGSIIYRMDNMPKDPSIDNYLKATGDARKAGLDYRLVDPAAPDFPQSKVNEAVRRIVELWKENDYRRGTQLVFCDLSVPASARGKATEAAQAKQPTWFIRRYGVLEHVAGVKAKLSAMPDHPFFTVKEKGGYRVYDAIGAVRIGDGRTKQEALDSANAALASNPDGMRAQFEESAIPPEEIDAYVQAWEDAKAAKDEADDNEEEDTGPAVSMDELLADQSKFSVYDDMKAKLIAAGIPPAQVAFIHDYNTDLQKADLFAKVNRGDIRVLFGSTQKMGAGMNVQKKLVALHNMDAPWRPSDLGQREGRIIRQGNEFYEADPDGFEVVVNRYGTSETYDAKQWEIIQTKAEGIEIFQAGDPNVREIDDISSEAANAADMKGAASGNPLILESIKLRKEIKDLEAQERSFTRARNRMESMVRSVEAGTSTGNRMLAEAQAVKDAIKLEDGLALTIDGNSYTERKAVKLEPIAGLFQEALQKHDAIEAGMFHNMRIIVDGRQSGKVEVHLMVGKIHVGNTSFAESDNLSAAGFVSRLENIVARVDSHLEYARNAIAQEKREAEQAREELRRGFPKEAELAAKRERSAKVVAALRSGKRAVDGDPEPAQKFSRRDPLQGDGAGQRARQVRGAIAHIVSRWGAAAPEVVVVDTAHDLPQVVRTEHGWQDVEGWYDDRTGTVYLVAGNLTSDDRARRVLAHEAVGHYGIEAIVGDKEWAQIRDTVYRMMKSGAHPELFAELSRRYKGVNEALFVREAVAVMAEKGMGRGVVSRVVAALRRFLRGIGFDLEFSERELRDLIGKSARYLRNGRRPRVAPEAGQAMAFAARPDRDWDAKVQVVGIAGGAFGDTNAVRQARAAAKNYLTRLRDSGHLMPNADTGWKIGLSRASINELVQFDQEKLNLLIALPRITNVAVLADSAPNRNPAAQGESIVAYHTLYAPVALNGEPRIARLVVQEHAGGRYAFDLQQSSVLNAQGPAGVARFPGVESGARRPGEAHTWTVGQLRDAVNAVNRPGWAFSQVADTFYSAMAESVAAGNGAPKKGTAEQWKGWLDGAQRRGEFKQAERDWLGVDAWLDGQGTVTREQLADFIRANEVQVQEVVLGEDAAPAVQSRIDAINDELNALVDQYGPIPQMPADARSRAEELTRQHDQLADNDLRAAERDFQPPKFARYQLPGGENYRELLLTLPGGTEIGSYGEWLDRKFGKGVWGDGEYEDDTLHAEFMREESKSKASFHSSHFDQPNILAHVRFNERTDADGKRVLFLEEVQSDWHQAGRKKGYASGNERSIADIDAELSKVQRERSALIDAAAALPDSQMAEFNRMTSQIRQMADRMSELNREWDAAMKADKAVPDAPFKGTDEWAMLAFKRMVRHAAENGFDRIAWTTGEQQAERYDLSKQVDAIRLEGDFDQSIEVSIARPGEGFEFEQSATKDTLADVVGKEIAEKALNDGQREFRGLDLKVGGAGMRGFYDKILPAAVNKWAKKFGGKVGNSSLDGGDMRGATISNGPAGYRVNFPDGQSQPVGSFDEGKALARAVQVHSLDLTDAMREAAMAGQPLFSRAPAEESVIAADTAFVAGLSDKERQSPVMAAFAEGLWRTEGTSSPFFQHWFGESKVVDAAGNPLKVYHGTNEEFAAFDPKRLGKSTNHLTAALGIFADARKEKAQHYAEIASNNVPAEQQLYELYLSVQNPYRMGKDEFMAIDSIDAARETRARLQREGFDGIQLYDIGQWVVFSPEQIKRTDNRGTFDGGDARLRFSRSDPAKVLDAMDTRTVPDSVFDKLRGWWSRGPISSTVENTRPSWLGALTLRHLAELGKDIKLSQVDDYAKRVQQMATDRNGLQEAGAKVAEGWEKFQKADRAGADATANLMHDTTIAAVDPSRAYVPLMTGATKRGGNEAVTAESIARRIAMVDADLDADPSEQIRRGLVAERAGLEALLAEEQARVQAYPELVRRYQALPEQGRQVYQSARQVYDDHSKALRDAIIARVKDSVESGDVRDAYIAQVRQTFEDARIRGPYFPLARFGEFWINAEKDGKPAFFMYENVQEWRAGQTDLARRGYVVKEAGRKIAEARSVAGVSSAFMADLEGVLKQSGADKQVMDDVWQMYLRTLPDLSMRKHFIHRKKVEGYSGDALRAFSGNVFHGSYQIARVRHSHKLVELLDSLKKATAALAGDDPERAAKAAALATELGQRHEWVMNPKDSKAVSWLTSLGFVWYLGATPAAAAVNLTQTAIVTFPVLASRFGVAKAWNTLAAATGRALRNVNGDLTRGLNDEERAAFALWEKSGAIDRTMAHNLAGLSETDTRSFNPVARRTMELVSLMFHKAEVVNREATALAAFRLARDAGQDFHTAAQYAADVVTESHFDYTNANRARWMQSNAAKVFLLFRQYSLNMTWLLWRNFYLGTKGETPAVRKEARKKLAGVLGMTALFSGVMGLPLMGLMFDLANAAAAAFGDDDEPFDAEVEFRNFLADLLGVDVARILTQGPIETMTGIELGSRVGLGELWLRTPDRELEGQALAHYLLEQAAGPVVGGMLVNTLDGAKKIADGHTWRGIETMAPKSVKDGMKALRYGKEGVNTMRGDPLIEDLSLGETLMQLAGFTPADVTERYDANSAAKNYEQRILGRRRALLNAYAMAWRAEDADGIQKALAKIQAWNAKHPAMGITLDTIRRSLASRMRYSARAESGVVLDRRIAEDAREQARFGL